MRVPEYLWNNADGVPEMERPLLNGEYSLSLFHVRAFGCYSAGRTLAASHAIGLIHGDVKPEHLFIDSLHGRTFFIDWGGSRESPLDPSAMATDFITPRITMTDDQLRALLAGYAGAAYEFLDARLAGYTDALLERLGGVWHDRPKPFPLTIEAETRVATDQVLAHDEPPSLDPFRLFAVVLAMKLAGDDRLDLERISSCCGDAAWITGLLVAESTIPGSVTSEERVSADLARQLRGVAGEEQMVRQILSFARGAPAVEARRIIDVIIEACDVLSLKSDDVEARSFARRSLMFLELTLGDPSTDERRLATMAFRHRSVLTLSLVEEEVCPETLLFDMAYWYTRSMLFLSASDRASKAEMPALPYLWRSLAISRFMLLRADSFATSAFSDNVKAILRRLASMHYHALRDCVVAFARSGDLLKTFVDDDGFEAEAVWTAEIAQALTSDLDAIASAVSKAPVRTRERLNYFVGDGAWK